MSQHTSPVALYRMYHSAVLSAPIEQVWGELRDFANTLRICFDEGVSDITWQDHGGPDHVPSTISFALQPGNLVITEVVSGRSDTAHTLTCHTVGVALNFASYTATFALHPITAAPGTTYIEWKRTFSLTPETDPDAFLPFYQMLADAEIDRAVAYFART